MWVICVGDIEFEIMEVVLENKNRNFVLPKHHQHGTNPNGNIIPENTSSINQHFIIIKPYIENIIK